MEATIEWQQDLGCQWRRICNDYEGFGGKGFKEDAPKRAMLRTESSVSLWLDQWIDYNNECIGRIRWFWLFVDNDGGAGGGRRRDNVPTDSGKTIEAVVSQWQSSGPVDNDGDVGGGLSPRNPKTPMEASAEGEETTTRLMEHLWNRKQWWCDCSPRGKWTTNSASA